MANARLALVRTLEQAKSLAASALACCKKGIQPMLTRRELDSDSAVLRDKTEKGLFRIEHALLVAEHAPFPVGAAILHDSVPIIGMIGAGAVLVFCFGTLAAYYGRPVIIRILAVVL